MFKTILIAMTILFAGVCRAGESTDPALGSADFHASPERPVGWRGDGTGRFPQANPPLKWGRISETMKGLRAQAAKPKGEASGDARPVELGQLTDWLVAGPFDVAGEKVKDELEREWTPAEAACEPDVDTKTGDVAWQKATADGEMLYFNKIFPTLSGKGVYAHAWLHSQTEGSLLMIMKGTSYRLWLNGTEVGRMDQDVSSTMNYKTARLKRGWNSLMLKTIAQRKDNKEACYSPTGTCFFQLHLCGADPNEKYEEENILWSAMPPQAGYFSCAQPIVAGDRVIVNADPWFLVCYDKATGKRLWTTYNGQSECATADERAKFPELFSEIDPKAKRLKEIAVGFNGTFAERKEMLQLYQDLRKLMKKVDKDRYFGIADRQEAGVAGLTSCYDGRFIYTWYADGIAVCHDLDGNRKWIRLDNDGPVGKDGSNDEHGYTTSPILIGDWFVITMKTATAFDKKTGDIKWKLSYGNKRFAGAMIAYDQTSDPTVAGENGIVSSLFEKVFLVPGKGYFATSKCTLEGNRAIVPMFDMGILYSVSELPPKLSADAKISRSCAGMPYNAGLEKNFDFNTPGTWYGQGTVANPLVYDGLIYSIGVAGVLNVNDFQTLKSVYAKWLGMNTLKGQAYPYPANSGVCASPTLGGKNIFLWGTAGTTFVIKPGSNFEVVAKNHIERAIPGNQNLPTNWYYNVVDNEGVGVHRECTVSSPIFDGDRIYYQGERYLYCIGAKGK